MRDPYCKLSSVRLVNTNTYKSEKSFEIMRETRTKRVVIKEIKL